MKTKYVIIESGQFFSEDDTLYKVMVGKSEQDLRAYKVMVDYALKHDCYLQMWSIEVRDFIEKLAHSVNRHPGQLKWVYLDVNDVAKHIRKYNKLPEKTFYNQHEKLLRQILSYIELPPKPY